MNSSLNLLAGWYGFLGGALSGALIGLYFPRDDWHHEISYSEVPDIHGVMTRNAVSAA